MAPKLGRPPKEVTKNVALGLRISQETAEKLQRCADSLKISRTEVIEKGIDLVEKDLKNRNIPPPWKVSGCFSSTTPEDEVKFIVASLLVKIKKM